MKQFDQFITEARITRASTQAKRLGLVGDGHGDWYDRQGQLKAKTIRGELKMFDARKAGQDEDEREKNSQTLASRSGASATATATAGGAGQAKPDVDRKGRALSNFQAKQQFDQAARDEPLTVAFDKFDDDVVGDNIIASKNKNLYIMSGNADEAGIRVYTDGKVDLSHNGTPKLETTTTGVSVQGLSCTGNNPVSMGSTTVSQLVLKDYTETVSVIGDTGTSATLNLANGNVFTATPVSYTHLRAHET